MTNSQPYFVLAIAFLFRYRLHSVISSQNFREKSGFSKGGSVWGGVTFQSALGERVLGRNLNFQISAWGGESDFRQFTTFVGISDMKI